MRRALPVVLILLVVPVALPGLQADTDCGPACGPVEWERVDLRAGEFADVVFAPSDPDVLYVGVEVNTLAFHKSTDGGASWERIEGASDHAKLVAVSPRDADVAYVAMSEAVLTTDLETPASVESRYNPDRGVLQPILATGGLGGAAGASFSGFTIFPGDDRIMYASVRGDGGHGGGPYGGTPAAIHKTTNRGATWTAVHPDVGEVYVVQVSARDPDLLFVGTSDGLFTTRDGGVTLTHVQDARVTSVTTTADDPARVYASSSHGVLVSRDGGASWSAVETPFRDVRRVRAAPSDADVVYAATGSGAWRTDDAGASWRNVSGDLRAFNLQALAVHPTDPDVAFVGHSSFWSSVRFPHAWNQGLLAHQGLFKTTDGGASWTRSDAGIEDREFEEVSTNPHRPFEAWVGSPASRGASVTADAGHSWRIVQTPTLHYPMRMVFHPADPDRVYATSWHTGGPFAWSEDGGVSWTSVPERVFFDGVARGSDLLRDARHGTIHLHALAVDPTDPDVLYAGSVADANNPSGFPLEGAHVFKSTDGGRSWHESDAGFPHDVPTAVHDIKVDPTDPRIVYLTTTDHEAEEYRGVWKSTDAGASWRAANDGLLSLNAHKLALKPDAPGTLLVATHGGVFLSRDRAASWEKVLDAPAFDVEYARDLPNVAYVSSDFGVHRSTDGGETWEDVTGALPEGGGHGIGVDATGLAVYAAVGDVGLFVARFTDVAPAEHGSAYPEGDWRMAGDGPPPEGGDDRERDPRRPFGDDDHRGRGIPGAGFVGALVACALGAAFIERNRRRG